MAKTRLDFDYSAFDDVMKDPGVVADVAARGARIRSACGSGYVQATEVKSSRVRTAIYTWSMEAILDNAVHQTLLRSLGAAR